jgi:hypothetical protein
LALGVLAEGERPEAVAVAVVAVADETDVAAQAHFFFDAAQVGAEFVVADETKELVFHVGAEGEGEVFFYGRGEGDGFDFPAETRFGALGELEAEAGGVDATAFDLREFEEGIEFTFDFGEGFVFEFEAEAVVGDGADFFAEVDDAEVVAAGNVDANEE